MASYLGPDGHPSLSTPGDANSDPFVTNMPGLVHHRFSSFDHDLFAAGPGSSPTQAKRALEAHLAETDRRLDEAGKLGTALVSQRKALAERLQEVEKLQKEGELGPELRQKLVDIEREFNDLARESARVFLPKQRVPSNEAGAGSPFVPEPRSGRRSVSPSKFESSATGSPTKLNVPNRKLRNQPASRVHDIEFAAEISTSLIAQVRNLQALLSERDEEIKTLQADRTHLEIESENLQQRVKVLDESEHRYKEENWNLETRLQEFSSLQREAADREKKLTQALNYSNAEKNATQKELDEVKLSHAKLVEENATAIKHHDIELGTAKRSIVVAEGERAAMQRKIDDLTSQNLELAKAFSMQRGRTAERETTSGMSDDEFETAADNITPEHSPPPSPIKSTPRHAMLETETIKTSLQHAQRTIQSQRGQLHREKTEKLELRRIIQDLRDDLEKARNETGPAVSTRRSRKVESKEFKKPQRLLGTYRPSRQEIVLDDPEWEDNDEQSPAASSAPTPSRPCTTGISRTDTSDAFETANEASESAFETANEPATETEEFQTGNEGLSDSDDDAETETESPSRGLGRLRRPPSLAASTARPSTRDSFDSTASTSADEDGIAEMRTPTSRLSSQRSRPRLSHMRSRQASEEPNFRGSPASFVSSGTAQPGQSLFAELQDYGGSDDESFVGTPSRRSIRSATPGSVRRALSPPPAVPRLPRVIMVDSGVMTDPVSITIAFEEGQPRPRSMASVVNAPADAGLIAWGSRDVSRPASTVSYSDTGAQYEQDIGEKLSQFPVPPTSQSQMKQPAPPTLVHSDIYAQAVEPREEPPTLPTPPVLRLSPLNVQHVEPVTEPTIPEPVLSFSSIIAEGLWPVAEPEVPRPELTMTSVLAESITPVAIPPPSLVYSAIAAEALEPVAGPDPLALAMALAPPPPTLAMSPIVAEHVQPVSEPEKSIDPPPLTLSMIQAEELQPREEPAMAPAPPLLSLSGIAAEHVRPREAIAPVPPVLSLSGIVAEHVQPQEEPANAPVPPLLSLSGIAAEHVQPREEPANAPVPPLLSLSGIAAEHVQPREEPVNAPVPPLLSLSGIAAEHVQPREAPASAPVLPLLSFTGIAAEHVQPREEPANAPAPPLLSFAGIAMEHVQPLSEPRLPPPELALSPIVAEQTRPITETPPTPPALALSTISSEHVEPMSPPVMPPTLPRFGFSSIASIETRPMTPRSPRRDGFILPRDDGFMFSEAGLPRTPLSKMSGSTAGGRNREAPPVIAEDETRQSPGAPAAATPESLRPFKEMSTNSGTRPSRKEHVPTNDQGAQTSLTSGAIDKLLAGGAQKGRKHSKQMSLNSVGSPDTTGTVRVYRSQESLGSLAHEDAVDDVDTATAPRPGSAASGNGISRETPPLPSNHRQVIDAARSVSSRGQSSTMPPPLWPASALKSQRPRTPSQQRPATTASGRGTPTPRAVHAGSVYAGSVHAGSLHAVSVRGRAEGQSPARLTTRSRQSSVSSFASELDSRFNMRPGGMAMDPTGFSPNTDPRMIQAITQTMIGEFLWKYTRKTIRGELSEHRHRRYFWVHPYTRTLNWSDRDPSTAGRTELKAKSVPIEAVRVVTDDNPMPPGLHRKSLVIISPGRTIKFTCTTGQRHETWFNALSYLLLRTNQEAQSEADEVAENMTREDVDEFNPQPGRQRNSGSRPRAPPSLSSYNSRTTRNDSLVDVVQMSIPTLTPSAQKQATPSRTSTGTLSKLSGYWKAGAPRLSDTFSSLRGRGPSTQNADIYEASEAHDSAEDLREMIERQDRDAHLLENVRACCDGKHDVGTLHHAPRRGRGAISHSHPGSSISSTPIAPTRSRA